MPNPTTIRKIYLKHIHLDARLQPRDGLKEEVVTRLMEAIENGAKLPPAAVFFDGNKNLLAGGRHRYEAHSRLGIKHLECEVHEGSFDDAWLFSRGDNKPGEPLNNEEKRRSVREMLEKPEFLAWSDRAIAAHVGVSNRFVGNIRKDLTVNGSQSDVRVGRDGRAVNTTNIGSNKPNIANSHPLAGTDLEDDDDFDDDPFADESPSLPPVESAPFSFEFLIGDEVAGTTEKGDVILGIISQSFVDVHGRERVFVKGDTNGSCFTDRLTLATGHYVNGLQALEPGHLVAWEWEGETVFGRFIEYSNDGRIAVADFFDPARQYEPKVKELAVRRWTADDRREALAIRDSNDDEPTLAAESSPANGFAQIAGVSLREAIDTWNGPNDNEAALESSSEAPNDQNAEEVEQEKELSIEEQIDALPLAQALALYRHNGHHFRQDAAFCLENKEAFGKMKRRIESDIRHKKGQRIEAWRAAINGNDPSLWEGCPACKGSLRFGERNDPCASCNGMGYTTRRNEGVSADVVRDHAESLRG